MAHEHVTDAELAKMLNRSIRLQEVDPDNVVLDNQIDIMMCLQETRARLEAAERERDNYMNLLHDTQANVVPAIELMREHDRATAAESALGACRRALEKVLAYEKPHVMAFGCSCSFCSARTVLADTAAAGAQRDERLRNEMKQETLHAEARVAELSLALTLLHDEMQINNTAGHDMPHERMWPCMEIARAALSSIGSAAAERASQERGGK